MEDQKITETEIWAYISNQSDTNAIEKIEQWKLSENYDEALFKKIERLYTITGENPYDTSMDISRAKGKFFETLETEKKSGYKWQNLLKYAAVFAVIITSATYLFFTNSNTTTIQTAYGEHKLIDLPDGSSVWLNASSTLSYSKDSPRTIYLDGEAFFEVAKNKEIPFTVDTPDHLRVKALGTSFNVKTYKQNTFTETVLFTGKVEVSSDKHFKERILMLPNDKITFFKKDKRIVKSKSAFLESIIGWKTGKIQFRDKPFKDIASDLGIQYNIIINFKNEELSNSKFTGSFEKNTPIQEILETLRITKPFEYQKISDNEYSIQ